MLPAALGRWPAVASLDRRWLSWILALGVGLGATRQVLAWPPLWGVTSGLARACFVLSALSFLASLIVDTADRHVAPRVCLGPLLALTPLCLPPAWLSGTQLLIVGVCAAALADWSREPSASGGPALAVSTHAFAVGVGITLLALAWNRRGHFDNDPAYYAGVARHIVATGRWEEPIVWHFQGLPNEAVHAPFDHWQPMTTLVLLLPMKLFGATDRVVYVTMACVSGASVVALASLLGWAAPLKSRALALAGTAAFGLSPYLLACRLDSETMPIVHVLFLSSLVLIARGHGSLAMVPAWCLPLTRLDAGLWAPLLTLAALARPSSDELRASRRHERTTIVCAAVACALLVLAVWRASHGTFWPPAGTRAATLGGYADLFTYADGLPAPSPFHLQTRWTVEAFSDAAKLGLSAWFDQPLLGLQPVWIVSALLLGATSPAPTGRVATAIVACVGFVAPWSSFHMYAPWRVPIVGAAALVVAALMGLDRAFGGAQSVLGRAAASIAGTALAGALVWGQWAGSTLSLPSAWAEEEAFRKIAPLLVDHVVLTPQPFVAVGAQSAPVVMLPWNGDVAVASVIRRFGITRWVMGIGGCSGATAALCDEVVAGRRELPGGIHLRLLPTPNASPGVRVFAVSHER